MMGAPFDATAGAGAFEERPGARLGRYELLVPIATGGMARVWAARLVGHGGFTKIVALKAMLPHLLEDPQFEAMFLDEARIAAKLRHPNVCETLDLGEDAGVLFLAMEWVDGPSLLRLTHTGQKTLPIPHRLAAHIVTEACAGLHAAHELRDDDGTPLDVIHRDVSPHNILLSSAGAVKLTDFGVAKALGQSYATVTGELKGKMAYMSPEQMQAGFASIDRRSDIFGLGCVLYEITTGHRPFEADSPAAVVHRILNANAARPRALDPAYPPDLESIVMTAIAHRPDERFSTADEMRVALGAYLAKREAITASDVAQLVGERYAADGDDRREQIRLACARRGSRPSYSEVLKPPSRPELLTLPEPRAAATLSLGPPGPSSGAIALGPSSVPPSKKPYSFKPTSFTPQFRPPPSSTPQSFAPRSSGAISVPASLAPAPRPAAVPARGRSPLVLAGAVMLAVVAASGWYMGRRRSPAPVVAVTPTAMPSAVGPPALTAAASEPGRSVSPRVSFHVLPKDAMMVVDGVLMPAGANSVDRPATGTRRVVFRAEKFEDYVEVIDTRTPAALDITLAPRGASVRRPASSVRRPTRPTPSSSSSALPNPYDE